MNGRVEDRRWLKERRGDEYHALNDVKMIRNKKDEGINYAEDVTLKMEEETGEQNSTGTHALKESKDDDDSIMNIFKIRKGKRDKDDKEDDERRDVVIRKMLPTILKMKKMTNITNHHTAAQTLR